MYIMRRWFVMLLIFVMIGSCVHAMMEGTNNPVEAWNDGKIGWILEKENDQLLVRKGPWFFLGNRRNLYVWTERFGTDSLPVLEDDLRKALQMLYQYAKRAHRDCSDSCCCFMAKEAIELAVFMGICKWETKVDGLSYADILKLYGFEPIEKNLKIWLKKNKMAENKKPPIFAVESKKAIGLRVVFVNPNRETERRSCSLRRSIR